ncbi:MAG: autotransporter domain-containing protein [Parachlamydiaceae bacterium]|nr:autotransporter domain-containing protein [Parachlamydiaceae bacterium]
MIKAFFLTLMTSLLACSTGLQANFIHDEDLLEAEVSSAVKGKVDIGPAFIHLDILESGRTIDRLDMMGVRADFSYFIHRGLYIKPTVLYGNGGSNKGNLFTASLGVGYLIPLTKTFLIAPSFGVNYGHIKTKIDFPAYQLKDLTETFKSWAPFIEADIYYTFIPGWRVCAGVQYSWSRSDIKIAKLESKSKSQGFAYSILLEHDLNDKWSCNIGAAYNLSLSKEKHGLRGTGVKAGIVRWF